MTLTFTGYDRSPECAQFYQTVRQAHGFVSNANYSKRSPAIVELIVFVPEQPELLTPPKP